MSELALPSPARRSTWRSRSVGGSTSSVQASAASCGSMTRSPRCTRRTASASCSAGMSLRRYPEAPASRARRRYPARANVVRMMTRTGTPRRFSSAATSNPVSVGISISVMNTSGRVCCTRRRASSPDCARAMTSISSSISSNAASAPRTMAWSSARNTLILSRLAAGMFSVSQNRGHGRERQMNHQAGAGGGLALQRAADRLQPFAHAAQAVALRTIGAASVIGDLQGGKLFIACQADAARLRLGVAHHVGYGFTKRQGKHGFLGRAQGNLRGFAVHGDARGFERLAGAEEFGGESLATISADGFAHVGQRGARSVLDVLHFLLGTLRVAVHQLARQLRLQGYERQRVSQQIVEVARDAFALGDLGQMCDLVLRKLKFFCRTVADRRVMASESHDGNQQQQRSPSTYGQMKPVGVEGENGDLQGNQHGHSAQVGVETARSRCVNQKCRGTAVEWD